MGITPYWEKMVKRSKIELGHHLMVPDIVYKFQMVCLRGLCYCAEIKWWMYGRGQNLMP